MRIRRNRVRFGSVAAILLLLQVVSAAVSSLNACCDNGGHAETMRCCLKAAASATAHMCPLMRGQQSPMPSGELRATCANGHDDGVPRGGVPALVARRVELVVEWPASAVVNPIVEPIWRPHASLSPPPRA